MINQNSKVLMIRMWLTDKDDEVDFKHRGDEEAEEDLHRPTTAMTFNTFKFLPSLHTHSTKLSDNISSISAHLPYFIIDLLVQGRSLVCS